MPELARKKIRPGSRFCSRQIKASRTVSVRGSPVRRNWRMCFEPVTRNWLQPPMTSRFSISTRDGPESSGAPSSICFRKVSPLAHGWRSEEHTSELQSRVDLVCRLLLEKKKKKTKIQQKTNKKKTT